MQANRETDRRPTRMSCYDYSQNGLYFLTICTHNRQKILCDIIVGDGVLDVPEIILTSTGKIVEKYIHSINNVDKLSVEKYVIMPDHIHLILYIDDIDLFGTSGVSLRLGPSAALTTHCVVIHYRLARFAFAVPYEFAHIKNGFGL